MKLVWWMISGSVSSWILLALWLGPDAVLATALGMLGPLASAVVSWIAMQRQHARQPERLTSLLIKAFAAKMIFFALYIVILLGIGRIRPVVFAVSFLGYFFCLHIVEAIGLRRLQALGSPANDPMGTRVQ